MYNKEERQTEMAISIQKPYYRREFNKIHDSKEQYTGKWNWAAFLFGGFWAISKGLWSQLGMLAVLTILTSWIGCIGGVIYWFVLGARGNYMHYNKQIKGETKLF